MPYIDPTGTLGGWLSYPNEELGYTQFVPEPPPENGEPSPPGSSDETA